MQTGSTFVLRPIQDFEPFHWVWRWAIGILFPWPHHSLCDFLWHAQHQCWPFCQCFHECDGCCWEWRQCWPHRILICRAWDQDQDSRACVWLNLHQRRPVFLASLPDWDDCPHGCFVQFHYCNCKWHAEHLRCQWCHWRQCHARCYDDCRQSQPECVPIGWVPQYQIQWSCVCQCQPARYALWWVSILSQCELCHWFLQCISNRSVQNDHLAIGSKPSPTLSWVSQGSHRVLHLVPVLQQVWEHPHWVWPWWSNSVQTPTPKWPHPSWMRWDCDHPGPHHARMLQWLLDPLSHLNHDLVRIWTRNCCRLVSHWHNDCPSRWLANGPHSPVAFLAHSESSDRHHDIHCRLCNFPGDTATDIRSHDTVDLKSRPRWSVLLWFE